MIFLIIKSILKMIYYYFLLIILFISIKHFLCSNIEELFRHVYPKLKYLSSEKSINFCNYFECIYNSNISKALKNIYNDSDEKYFCMINNSFFVIINENESLYISSNFSEKMEEIKRYNIIPYMEEENIINYIIIFINSNNTSINYYNYIINISNINYSNYLNWKLIKYISIISNQLSNDINCQIIYSNNEKNLLCFYYIYNSILQLSSISFNLKNFSNEMNFDDLNTTIKGEQNSIIKSSILNEKEIFIGLFCGNNIIGIVYDYISNKIIYNFIIEDNNA